MNTTTRVFSRTKADRIEKETSIRTIGVVFQKRLGKKPLFIRSIVAQQNE